MDDWTAGTWGGVTAGVITVLAALGKGLAWLLNFNESRSSGREQRLRAWEQSLAEREKAYREEIETQLADARAQWAKVEDEVRLLRGVVSNLATALRNHDPINPALVHAEQSLGTI